MRLADPRVQSVLVFVLAFALYANTLGHGYVLDDGLVLSDNAYVRNGIPGIADILSHDSFHGAIGDSENLSGGRYRPLSLVMFACERSFFGEGPFAHHLINVLLYGLTAVLLLRLLWQVAFPIHPFASLAAVVLFVVHPIHTEVVANIKSRDEILSLLFLLGTLSFLLSVKDTRSDRIKAAVCYALALLSKENGIIFLGVAPIALFTFRGVPLLRAFMRCWPLAVVAVLYLVLRVGIIGTRVQEVPGVLDNPYVLAVGTEKIATILAVLAEYFRLLTWPHPLTYDYSFAQIPYRTFGDPVVWFGIALLTILVVLSLRALVRRDLVGWCAVFFLGTWLVVSGLFFNLGAPMAERFLYQASVPFVVALVELARRVLSRTMEREPRLVFVASGLSIGLCAMLATATVVRNRDWRDGNDLLIHDVAVSAHSARANAYAGIAYVRKAQGRQRKNEQRELSQRALEFFSVAEGIVPGYMPTLLNRGVAYFLLDSIPAAEKSWDQARTIEPENTMLTTYDAALFEHYFRAGMQAGAVHDLPLAIASLEKAVHYGPSKADAWYNLGGACFTAGDTARARATWEQALRLDPAHSGARQGLAALGH